MEANMQRRAAGLKDKMPDIQKTLETVQFLKTRKVDREAQYMGYKADKAGTAWFWPNRSYIRA